MEIKLTQEDHEALIELLNDIAELRYNQAAALVKVAEANNRLEYCLRQARSAAKLLTKLVRYGTP